MENNKNHNGGFGQGFMLGLLVGIVGTLLVTTKKGREIFRELTTKGLDKFSDLEQRLQETGAFEEFDDEDDYIAPAPRTLKTEAHPEEEDSVREVAQEEERAEKPVVKSHPPRPSHIRRFFRGKKA
ncbi:MAG TPA: YtxH domain-containing protein [Methylomirabilota bacterium]|nr:YtxH domain-containing protein [Methylomirabilota bacterium]